MIGSIEECKFFSIGEMGELIYQHFHDAVRYISFKDDIWECRVNEQWDPISKEQVRQMFVEYVNEILTKHTQTLNMKYFSYIGDYERDHICDKIAKIQCILKNIRTDMNKYGDLLLDETCSLLHIMN